MLTARKREILLGLCFLLPSLLLIIFVSYAPFIWNLMLSFQKWNGFLEKSWIGLSNYVHIFNDETAIKSFSNTTKLGLFIPLFSVTLGIVFAFLIYPIGKGEGAFFRFALFTPSLVPTSIIAIIFTFIFSTRGILNALLKLLGLESLATAWLGNKLTVIPSLIFVEVYQNMGITMLLCFAAMQMVPSSILEASKIDGIGYARQFVHIILPLIRPIIQLCVILTLISGFRTYDSVRILTNGGPGSESKIVSMHMIDNAFVYGEFGYAASLGALFTVILLVAVLLATKVFGGESYEY